MNFSLKEQLQSFNGGWVHNRTVVHINVFIYKERRRKLFSSSSLFFLVDNLKIFNFVPCDNIRESGTTIVDIVYKYIWIKFATHLFMKIYVVKTTTESNIQIFAKWIKASLLLWIYFIFQGLSTKYKVNAFSFWKVVRFGKPE